MPEIIEIIYILAIFFLFILSPLNVFKLGTNNLYFNLIINLNILLFFSILPLQISKYSIYILLFLSCFIFRNYYSLRKNIKIKEIAKSQIILLISTFFILSIQVSSQLELGWDAKFFWYIKSLFYSQNQTFSELSNYTYNYFHPHFGSFLWGFFRNFSINDYEYTGRLFYVFFYLISIYFISKNIFKNKIHNMLVFLFLIVLTQKYLYFSGLQEILIFTTLIFISKFIFIFLENRKFIYLFYVLLCINLLIWFKSEGVAYAAITIVVVNLISKLNIKFRLYFNFLFLFLMFFKISIYKFFKIKGDDRNFNLEYFLNLDFDVLIYKSYNIIIYLSYNSLKNIVLIIVPILIILNYKKIYKDEYLRLVGIFFVLNIIFIFSAYIFREMEIVFALQTTIDRIIFSSSGFYLVFLINQIKSINKSNYFF